MPAATTITSNNTGIICIRADWYIFSIINPIVLLTVVNVFSFKYFLARGDRSHHLCKKNQTLRTLTEHEISHLRYLHSILAVALLQLHIFYRLLHTQQLIHGVQLAWQVQISMC